MLNHPIDALYHTARTALLEAGAILRKGFAGPRRVFFKTETSPVTQIDVRSERRIMAIIRRRFPDHTFLAEESDFRREGDRGPSRAGRYRWVIDPLDGTVNYLHRVPMSCVSIAVEYGGTVLAGGVYDPFRDELFMAKRGGGATLNGKRIHVSGEARFRRSLLITGFPYDHSRRAGFYLALIEPFLKKSMDVRRFGAAAIDLAWIACGRAEGFWELKLSPWDVAAGKLLVEEAGGRITDFLGGPFSVDRPVQTLATNGRIHPFMMREFRALGRRFALK